MISDRDGRFVLPDLASASFIFAVPGQPEEMRVKDVAADSDRSKMMLERRNPATPAPDSLAC